MPERLLLLRRCRDAAVHLREVVRPRETLFRFSDMRSLGAVVHSYNLIGSDPFADAVADNSFSSNRILITWLKSGIFRS